MAIWKILRREPGSKEDHYHAGETYDDKNGKVADYIKEIKKRDGWDYKAEKP